MRKSPARPLSRLSRGGDLRTYLIDEQEHSGSNDNLEVGDCAVCRDHINLCISDPGGTIFAFYSIIEAQ